MKAELVNLRVINDYTILGGDRIMAIPSAANLR